MPETAKGLVRTIGRASLAGLMINTIIGSGIFGLPSVVAGKLGKWAPLGYVLAGAGIAVIAGCLSEVASQFRESGGPYLYARETLGRFWGIQIAWMTWLSRIAAASGTANLFTTYLAQVVPQAELPFYRAAILTLLIGALATVNYRGVRSGTRLSDFFTGTKLLLLLVFIVTGLAWMGAHRTVSPTTTHAVMPQDWLDVVLVLVYAYGGFEAVLLAAGEMRDPRRDVPTALLIAVTLVAVVYILVQVVVNSTLPNPAGTQRPLAESAGYIFGPGAAVAVALGALISIYGYLSANMLHTPRLTFALAECGDFPAIFGRIHPRFRTPHVSILLYTALFLGFALGGNFQWNVTLSAIARLFTYASVAVALLVLRRRNPRADAYRLPGGKVLAAMAILFCGVLLLRAPLGDSWVVLVTASLAAGNWFLAARRSKESP